MMKRLMLVLGICFLIVHLDAQALRTEAATTLESVRTIVILPLEQIGSSEAERVVMERLIGSYLEETGSFRLIALPPSDAPWPTIRDDSAVIIRAAQEIGAEYAIIGSLASDADGYALSLRVHFTQESYSREAYGRRRGLGELAVDAKAMVQQVLEPDPVEVAAPEILEATAYPIEMRDLEGTWKGDKGFEYIRVFEDGHAIARLSSGAQMKLDYTVEGTRVRFIQTSPNTILYYHPVPYNVAVHMVEVARPMEWVFQLSPDNKRLTGIKITTAVVFRGEEILEVQPESKRAATWNRQSR